MGIGTATPKGAGQIHSETGQSPAQNPSQRARLAVIIAATDKAPFGAYEDDLLPEHRSSSVVLNEEEPAKSRLAVGERYDARACRRQGLAGRIPAGPAGGTRPASRPAVPNSDTSPSRTSGWARARVASDADRAAAAAWPPRRHMPGQRQWEKRP